MGIHLIHAYSYLTYLIHAHFFRLSETISVSRAQELRHFRVQTECNVFEFLNCIRERLYILFFVVFLWIVNNSE